MKKLFLVSFFIVALAIPRAASADIFGGDVVVLTQIFVNAIQQLMQLKKILSTGSDTLSLMRDINDGIRNGLSAIQMLDPKFNPGLYADLTTADRVLAVIDDLYGKVPATAAARLERMQDRSAGESIAMNSTLFDFANQADEESRQIIAHAAVVNPGGAAKLTAQSIAVLTQVTTQLLRTNSMMLKMMGENMALSNRREKLESLEFKTQYEGISGALSGLPKSDTLPTLH
jgi:hypothetical protein